MNKTDHPLWEKFQEFYRDNSEFNMNTNQVELNPWKCFLAGAQAALEGGGDEDVEETETPVLPT